MRSMVTRPLCTCWHAWPALLCGPARGQQDACSSGAPPTSRGCLSRRLRDRSAPGVAAVKRNPPPTIGAAQARSLTTCNNTHPAPQHSHLRVPLVCEVTT